TKGAADTPETGEETASDAGDKAVDKPDEAAGGGARRRGRAARAPRELETAVKAIAEPAEVEAGAEVAAPAPETALPAPAAAAAPPAPRPAAAPREGARHAWLLAG